MSKNLVTRNFCLIPPLRCFVKLAVVVLAVLPNIHQILSNRHTRCPDVTFPVHTQHRFVSYSVLCAWVSMKQLVRACVCWMPAILTLTSDLRAFQNISVKRRLRITPRYVVKAKKHPPTLMCIRYAFFWKAASSRFGRWECAARSGDASLKKHAEFLPFPIFKSRRSQRGENKLRVRNLIV